MAVVVARLDPPLVIASRRRSIAALRSPEAAPGGGEPILELGIEAVLRLTGLQVEETEHERAGESKQRRRERDSDAAERRGESLLERLEYGAGIATGLEAVDHVADRAHGLDQAPKRAEQAEEHEQAGHVARRITRFIQAGGDRIEDAAHHLRRDRHAADAVTQQHGHR